MASVSYKIFMSARRVQVCSVASNPLLRRQYAHWILLQVLGYCMIAFTTCFIVARFVIRTIKHQFYPPEDLMVILAWMCHEALCVLYIRVTPAVYRISAVGRGETAVYPTLKEDAEFLTRMFFPSTLLLWFCLWLSKAALLLQCRRLIVKQQRYLGFWWSSVVFTSLVFVGCVITEFTSCRSLHAWFTYGQRTILLLSIFPLIDQYPGECQSPRDAGAAVISLYYSFGVDVVTNLLSTCCLTWRRSARSVSNGCFSNGFPSTSPVESSNDPAPQIMHHGPILRWKLLHLHLHYSDRSDPIQVRVYTTKPFLARGLSNDWRSCRWVRSVSPSNQILITNFQAVVVVCLPTFGLLFRSQPSRNGFVRQSNGVCINLELANK